MAQLRDKLVSSLSTFMSHWRELEDTIFEKAAKECGEETKEAQTKAYNDLVTEMQATVSVVLEHEPYATEEIAGAMSCVIDALEQLDPELFAESEDDEDEDEDDLLDDDEDDAEDEEDDDDEK